MMQKFTNSQTGFTFIEVLLAIVILVIVILVAIDLSRGSVLATRDIKEMTTATWLLKKTMVELESKIETEGFEKACDKKKTGKFDAPYDKYTWETNCIQIDFKLSETAAAALDAKKDNDDEKASKENQLQKFVLGIASSYITKSMRELHAEVKWIQGKAPRKVDVTTHTARYDQPLTIPTIGTGGGGS